MSNLEAPARRRFLKAYKDRRGVPRFYFRRRGCPSIPIKGDPGSEEFEAAYRAALKLSPHFRSRKTIPGGHVYVVRVRGFDLAKIGFSMNPTRRIAELEAGSGMAGGLETLAVFPAGPAVERKLHARFAEERLFGEWFRLSGAVETWAATIMPHEQAA